jgi:integrase
MSTWQRETSGGVRVFWGSGPERRAVRFGAIPDDAAREIASRVESIRRSTAAGVSLGAVDAAWASGLSDEVHAKLAAAGLFPARVAPASLTLSALLDRHLAGLTIKESTATTYEQAIRSLVDHFGKARRVDLITAAEAADWRTSMVAEGLAPATVSRRAKWARNVFAQAHRQGILTRNPFELLKGGQQSNEKRRVFVPAAQVVKLMDAAPEGSEIRALLALARWGGCRVPSEALSMQWNHVAWDARRLTITSPKTEGQGKGSRLAPLWPELERELLALHSRADDGATWVFPRLRTVTAPGAGLQGAIRRLAERAGISLWCKPWQNLRASRANELFDRYPAHVAASWMGHCASTAQAHYLRVDDAHFTAALADPAPAPAAGVVQFCHAHGGAPERTERSEPAILAQKSGDWRTEAHQSAPVAGLSDPMGIRTFSGKHAENAPITPDSGAVLSPRSGDDAPSAQVGAPARTDAHGTPEPADEQLARILELWPSLSDEARAAVVAAAQAFGASAARRTPPTERIEEITAATPEARRVAGPGGLSHGSATS